MSEEKVQIVGMIPRPCEVAYDQVWLTRSS